MKPFSPTRGKKCCYFTNKKVFLVLRSLAGFLSDLSCFVPTVPAKRERKNKITASFEPWDPPFGLSKPSSNNGVKISREKQQTFAPSSFSWPFPRSSPERRNKRFILPLCHNLISTFSLLQILPGAWEQGLRDAISAAQGPDVQAMRLPVEIRGRKQLG